MADKHFCKHCGKEMTYNRILHIWECDDSACWIMRSKANFKKVKFRERNPGICCKNEDVVSLLSTTFKSGYLLLRAAEKSIKKKWK